MKKITLTLAAVFAVALAAGCSSSNNDTNEPTEDAGAGADTGAEQIRDTCVKACDHLNECNHNVELPKCQEQCGKELRGDGYLTSVTAKALFETIRDLDVQHMTKEEVCNYPADLEPWYTWEEKLKQSGDISDYPIEDASVWDRCVKYDKKCHPNTDETTLMTVCARFATYNKKYTSAQEQQCMNNPQVSCSEERNCAMKLFPQVVHPWFGGVPDSFNWHP